MPDGSAERSHRIDAVIRAVEHLARHPSPESLGDGLSEAMARRCLALATGLITRPGLESATDLPGRAPARVAVVAARGVFAAPLEWVALLASVGSRVLLKAPALAPAFCEAVVEAFSAEGLPAGVTRGHDLPAADALVAMGSDSTMAALAAAHPQIPCSLHGHRFSLAVIEGSDPSPDEALADDVALYDGRGCFTPVAVFQMGDMGDALRRAEGLSRSLERAQRLWPAGQPEPLLGPEWRRRLALAHARGRAWVGERHVVTCATPNLFEAAALPRFITVHPIADWEELTRLLKPWAGRIAGCATDLSGSSTPIEALLALGCERICRPGQLQAPPLGRPHGGREALRSLMWFPSIEL